MHLGYSKRNAVKIALLLIIGFLIKRSSDYHTDSHASPSTSILVFRGYAAESRWLSRTSGNRSQMAWSGCGWRNLAVRSARRSAVSMSATETACLVVYQGARAR